MNRKDLSTGAFNERVEMNVTRVQIGLHVVVVVAVPRGKDNSVRSGSAEVDHDVVQVSDLRRLNVDLQVSVTAERHYWRI